MKGRAALAVTLLVLVCGAADSDKDKPKQPFYSSYLIPGDPLDEKIKAQEKRVEADPGSATLRNDFGNLLAARGFPGDARRQYREAMKLDRKNFLAPYNLGLLEETQGNNSAAIAAYEDSIKRKPGFPASASTSGSCTRGRAGTTRPSSNTQGPSGSTRPCAIRGAIPWRPRRSSWTVRRS